MLGKISAVTLPVIFCLCANIFTGGICDEAVPPVPGVQGNSRLGPSTIPPEMEVVNEKLDLLSHAFLKRSPHYDDYGDDDFHYEQRRIHHLTIPKQCISLEENCWVNSHCCSSYCHWPDGNFFGKTVCKPL